MVIQCICRKQNRICTARTLNRALPVLRPHLCWCRTALPLNAICIVVDVSELLCRKSRFTVSMGVVGWWPGSSLHGCMPVLPDYHAHRGLLSSGLWNKCERTERALYCSFVQDYHAQKGVWFLSGKSAVESPCRCGSCGGIHIQNIDAIIQKTSPVQNACRAGYSFIIIELSNSD